MRRLVILIALAIAAVSIPLSATATAPPVGALPKGPVTTITVPHGLDFAIALPMHSGGFVWRGARRVDIRVARPLTEVELGSNIVLTYRAVHAGKTTLVYALTKGETPKAYEARYFPIVVR